MLHLKNIVRNDTQISADYYPEDSDEKGYICVDIRTEEIVRHKCTSYDGPLNTYAYHAAQALRRMIPRAELPINPCIMWY